VSYADFKKYLNNTIGPEVDFFAHILPKMKEIATDSIKATYAMLDPEKKQHNFELFGLDFMLDEDLNVYLIEVNTNPCLETSCPLLTKILTPLIENVFK
jgi:D-alanine-D-alanine ligase-like ATP-grasp enzyme